MIPGRFLKTYPIADLGILGHDTDRFLENSIRTVFRARYLCDINYVISLMKIELISFQEISLVFDRKLEILDQNWMGFTKTVRVAFF